MPETWVFVAAAVVLAILALAAWSDRRDRRSGIDPRQRVEALGQRKKDRRQRRSDWISRRIGADRGTDGRPGAGRSEDRPWER